VPWPAPAAPPAPLVFPLEGTPPVSTAWMTIDWKLAGMPRCFSLLVRLDRNCALTSAPRTATPITAPISRLVLVAEAAMPDRAGGTADSASEGIGTTVAPIPRRVSARPAASGRYAGCGFRVRVVSSRPAPNIRQPRKIDQRGPAGSVLR